MNKKKFKKSILIISTMFFLVFSVIYYNFVFSSSTDNLSGYGWGGDWVDLNSNSVQNLPDETTGGMGWLSFNCVNEAGTCGTGENYGVGINPATGDVTGYAWSSNYGWLKFGGLANFPTGGAPSSNWYNSSWTKRIKVTIQSSQVSSTLTDFPVYVDLANLPAGFHASVNQTDARDIRVTTSNGTTEVPIEVVFYNSSTDTGELHFKAPSISNSSNTDFYIYYGNTAASQYAASATYGRNNVWSNGYSAVYHFQEVVNNNVGGYADSTSNGNNGQGVSMSMTEPNGKLSGKSAEFDGTADYISVPHQASLNITNDLSMEGWVYGDVVTNNGILMKGPLANSQGTYNLIAATAGTGWYTRLNGSITEGAGQESGGTPSTAAWNYITGYRAGTTLKLRVNKIELGSSTYGTVLSTNSNPLIIGGYFSTSNLWNGKLDELRISNSGRSTEWFDTQYNNQNSPATFYNTSTEETYSAGGGPGGTVASNAKFVGTSTNGNFNGTLQGWARFCGVAANPESCLGFVANDQNGGWDGWVSLSGTAPNYNVSVANNVLSGYAWGGNDNNKNVIGWIDFSGVNITDNTTYLDFYATPSPVFTPNLTTVLKWAPLNGVVFNTCIADSASPLNPAVVPAWQSGVPISNSGTLTVTVPYNPTTYKITCTDTLGAVHSKTIAVPKVTEESLTLRNDRVLTTSGVSKTVLRWTAVNLAPNSCVASTINPNTGMNWTTTNPKTPPTTGSPSPTSGLMTNVIVTSVLPAKTTYTLSCVGAYSGLPVSASLDLHTTSGSSSNTKVPVYNEN